MTRKTREREALEKLSDLTQKVFKIIGVKGTQGFVGLTFSEIVDELLRKGIAYCNDDFINGLTELERQNFVEQKSVSKGMIFQLTDKGDKAFF
ncbi:hypothetical protein FJY93_00055 [Candidatus Kaiserbacteria bacterium]|nr:hypothetical protein [Candidatus Kaiserbacteria bacterium]